jgi:peptidoglycan/xylan/chitin deacetylase (PgdA/CDA1 family)
MVRKAKLLLSRLITRIAWESVYKRRDFKNRLPILCYHRVLPELIEAEESPVYTVLPEQFEAHLDLLAREGFTSLTLKEFGEMATGVLPPPRRGVMITFDDGYADNYAIAWPICRKHRMKLNLFISTGTIGDSRPMVMTKQGYRFLGDGWEPAPYYFRSHLQKYSRLWKPLTWRELREMHRAGVHLGLHGHSHHNLAFLPEGRIIREAQTGAKVFQEHLGFRPEYFALPYGGYEANVPEVLAALQQGGMRFVFTTLLGRARLPSAAPIFPRLLIYQQDNLEVFRRKLFGAYDWLEPAGHLLHRGRVLLGGG